MQRLSQPDMELSTKPVFLLVQSVNVAALLEKMKEVASIMPANRRQLVREGVVTIALVPSGGSLAQLRST